MSDKMEVKPPFHLPPTTPTKELRKQDIQEWAIEDFTNCEPDPTAVTEEENRGEEVSPSTPLSTPLSPWGGSHGILWNTLEYGKTQNKMWNVPKYSKIFRLFFP